MTGKTNGKIGIVPFRTSKRMEFCHLQSSARLEAQFIDAPASPVRGDPRRKRPWTWRENSWPRAPPTTLNRHNGLPHPTPRESLNISLTLQRQSPNTFCDQLLLHNQSFQIKEKMAKNVLSRKTGVIVGDDVLHLFQYAQEKNFAIPAINVTSSSTAVAAMEAARDTDSPVILQMSQGGSLYFAGKSVPNGDQAGSIAGAIAGAHYIRSIAPTYNIPVVLHTDHCAKKLLPWLDGMLDEDEKYFKEHGESLFSSHMIDLSEEPVDWNIETTAKYLKRAAPMKQWLEMVRSPFHPLQHNLGGHSAAN